MLWKMKNWLLRLTEPWREEQAALDLEWEVFARKHNAAGKRPMCYYSGMELDPLEKVKVYEFPNGDEFADPDCLIRAHAAGAEKMRLIKKKVTEQNAKDNNRKGLTEKDHA